MILWTYDPAERDARLANKILKEKKKSVEKLKIIVEISCTHSPSHLIAVRKAYCSLFDLSLEEHIASSVPFPLAKVSSSSSSSHNIPPIFFLLLYEKAQILML